MQFTVQKLYTNKLDVKIQARFLLVAKIKKEGLNLPFYLEQLLKNEAKQWNSGLYYFGHQTAKDSDLWEVGYKLNGQGDHTSFLPEEFADCSTGRGICGSPAVSPTETSRWVPGSQGRWSLQRWVLLSVLIWGNDLRPGWEPPSGFRGANPQFSHKARNSFCLHQADWRTSWFTWQRSRLRTVWPQQWGKIILKLNIAVVQPNGV